MTSKIWMPGQKLLLLSVDFVNNEPNEEYYIIGSIGRVRLHSTFLPMRANSANAIQWEQSVSFLLRKSVNGNPLKSIDRIRRIGFPHNNRKQKIH